MKKRTCNHINHIITHIFILILYLGVWLQCFHAIFTFIRKRNKSEAHSWPDRNRKVLYFQLDQASILKKSFIFGTRWGCGEVGRNLGGWQTHIHTPTRRKCPFTSVSPHLLHILLITVLSSFCAPSDLWFIRAALWHSGSCPCAAHSHTAAQSLCPASCRTKPAHPSLLRRGFYFAGHARFGPTGQGQQRACLMKTLNNL